MILINIQVGGKNKIIILVNGSVAMGKMIFHTKNSVDFFYFNRKNYEIQKLNQHQAVLSDDVPFNNVCHLKGYNLPRDLSISSDARLHSCYPNLEYINLFRTNDRLVIIADVNYWLNNWDEKINLLSFVEKLRERLGDIYSIESEQNNIFEEMLINIRFKITVDCEMRVHSAVDLLDSILCDEQKSILSYETVKYKISLSTRHQQAGKSLLHYLHKVMEYKKLSDDLTVSVTENNHFASVSLEFPESMKGQILDAVYSYGLILKGELSSCSLLKRKAHRHNLKMSLNAIQRRIDFQNRQIYDAKMMFVSSEEESNWLKLQVGNCLTGESSPLEAPIFG